MYMHTYNLFTGWEVRNGRNCARGLEYRPRPYSDRGHSAPNTDRPRPVNNIFIFSLLRFSSFRKIFLQSPTYACLSRRRVDEARERLQTTTKHCNTIFSSAIYILALTALF